MKEWISITELRELLDKALTIRNIPDKYKEFIIEDLITAELQDKKTHGIGKVLLLDEALKMKEDNNIELIKEFGNYALYDGHKELGHIAALTCIDKVISLAKTHGNGIVALRNASRYGRLKPFAKIIADNNLIGIVMNNAGPAAVTAYGGITPILGTNPICFSFPSNNDDPYLFDFSTSKKVWGEIRQSTLANKDLPENCFLDKEGHFTKDPSKADSVIAFGDNKGFALCLAIEMLAGAFTGSKVGLQVDDEYDLGFVFMAFNPEMFGDLEEFKNKLKVLEKDIKNSIKNDNTEKIYIPGEVSKEKLEKATETGKVEVATETLNRLRQMAISIDGGIESNNKMN